jgi:NADH dehydrogenase/NADH:ubiquinone oxidoreductase subunit G
VDVGLIIDGERVVAPEGSSLLTAARAAGRDVPGLCHHEAVPDIAACRLCLVEVRRPGLPEPLLTTSCNHRVAAGLDVVTDSPRIRRHRIMNLHLLLPYAPESPVMLELCARLGVAQPLFAPVTDAPLPGCILCELCVRVCSAMGYSALSASGRGDHKSVGPPFGQAAAAECVGCGSCHSVCPTKCIAMEDTPTTRTVWGRTFDLCACRRCGAPFMTETHRAATAARGDLPAEYYTICDACKRIVLSENLLTAVR